MCVCVCDCVCVCVCVSAVCVLVRVCMCMGYYCLFCTANNFCCIVFLNLQEYASLTKGDVDVAEKLVKEGLLRVEKRREKRLSSLVMN